MAEPKETNKQKGDDGEQLAADYLQKRGYQILYKKWKHGRYELDLIAENNTHIVFVEVKLRYSDVFGLPWEAVNHSKRKKICLSADAYIKKFDPVKEPRFDIISIIKSNGRCDIQHIDEAFFPMA